MPDKTATQNLTRPQSSDRVRDNWLYAKTLALEVDGRLTGHDTSLRLSKYPPTAVMEATFTRSYAVSGGSILRFDTVLVDNAGMIDLAQSDQRIKFTRTGFYQVGLYVQAGNVDGTGVSYMVDLDSQGGFGGETQVVNTESSEYAALSLDMSSRVTSLISSGQETSFWSTITVSGSLTGSTVDVNYAQLWAYWLREHP